MNVSAEGMKVTSVPVFSVSPSTLRGATIFPLLNSTSCIFPFLKTFNFNQSEWSNRLQSFHQSFLDFQTKQKFDLIVSNPPFFNGTTKPNSNKRKLARHDDSLHINDLINKSRNLLNEDGIIALVLPFDQIDGIKKTIDNIPLYINRRIINNRTRKTPIYR